MPDSKNTNVVRKPLKEQRKIISAIVTKAKKLNEEKANGAAKFSDNNHSGVSRDKGDNKSQYNKLPSLGHSSGNVTPGCPVSAAPNSRTVDNCTKKSSKLGSKRRSSNELDHITVIHSTAGNAPGYDRNIRVNRRMPLESPDTAHNSHRTTNNNAISDVIAHNPASLQTSSAHNPAAFQTSSANNPAAFQTSSANNPAAFQTSSAHNPAAFQTSSAHNPAAFQTSSAYNKTQNKTHRSGKTNSAKKSHSGATPNAKTLKIKAIRNSSAVSGSSESSGK